MSEKELDLWWSALEVSDLVKYFVPFTSDYNEFLDALDDEWEKKTLQEKKDFYWSFRSAIEETDE